MAALLTIDAATAERLDRGLGLPALEDVDPPWGNEVGRQRKIEAAGGDARVTPKQLP